MSIGSTIKKLRREHDMTQEQLAEFLGITANAVSQWECGKTSPDISQLPILANLFEVTTDFLLGVDVTNKQAEINRICREAWNLCNTGNKTGAADILRTAIINYPNSYKIMSDLTIFLYQRVFQQNCSAEEQQALCREAAGYIDKILSGCNDMKIYGQSIELAANIFPMIGRYDDALRLIDSIPDVSKDEILTALYSGNQLQEHIKDIICKSVAAAADQTIWLASQTKADGTPLFDENKKIKLYEKAIAFYRTLYEEEDYFFDAESLAEAEKHIADIYAARKDSEMAFHHLDECIRCVIMFDTYDESKDTYTSLIPFGRTPVGINWNNACNKSCEMLMRLNTDVTYDFLRNDDRFVKLLSQLARTDNRK